MVRARLHCSGRPRGARTRRHLGSENSGPPGRQCRWPTRDGSRQATVCAVTHPAPVMDAVGVRLGTIREHVSQIREFRVAVFLDEPGDVIATAPAAALALDRKGRDTKIRERMGVFSHASSTGAVAPSRLFCRLARYFFGGCLSRGVVGDGKVLRVFFITPRTSLCFSCLLHGHHPT